MSLIDVLAEGTSGKNSQKSDILFTNTDVHGEDTASKSAQEKHLYPCLNDPPGEKTSSWLIPEKCPKMIIKTDKHKYKGLENVLATCSVKMFKECKTSVPYIQEDVSIQENPMYLMNDDVREMTDEEKSMLSLSQEQCFSNFRDWNTKMSSYLHQIPNQFCDTYDLTPFLEVENTVSGKKDVFEFLYDITKYGQRNQDVIGLRLNDMV